MNGRPLYCCLFFGLCFVGALGQSHAQTITTGALSISPVCAGTGGTGTVSFTTSSTFAGNNTFSAQLSDVAGVFPANPTVIGTSKTAPTISVTIPSALPAGSLYKIRVVSSNPAVTGSASSGLLVVKPLPTAPVVAPPPPYCEGNAPAALTATASVGGTLNWYGTNATGGTASPTASTPTGNATYYVSQTINGCESARAGIVVTFVPPPPAPTVTAPAPYCEGAGAAPLTATGQNLRWYGTGVTGGVGSNSATVPNTTLVGTTNYYVSQTVSGCESPRAAIAVLVKDTPAAPAITPASAYCQNQAAAPLVAAPLAGASLNWYGTNAAGGTASGSATVPAATQAGTFTYYVSQTLNGCESPRAPIGVTVKPIPGAPPTTPVLACQNRPATALSASAAASATLNWYGTDAAGGTASPTAPVPATDVLGGRTYYVSQTVNGCESARSSLLVTTNAVPLPPAATPPAAYCEGSSAQALSATASAGGALKWYGTNATGGTGTGSATVPGTNSVGTTNYYVTQTVSSCESDRTAIPVLVKDTPDKPGTAPVDFCQGTQPSALTASLVANATPNWYGTDGSGGTASGTAPTPGNATVGTITYYVSQKLDGCEGPRASLSVRVKATPGAPGVSRFSFCNNGPAQPLSASGSNIKWFDGNGNSLGGAPTPPTNNVGDLIFRASQTSNEGCEGPRADVVVSIKPLPGAPSVANVSYCQATTDQPAQNVSVLSAGGQNLRWYNPDGNAFPNAPMPAIDRAGVQTYQVSQTVNDCEGGRATLQVTVNTVPAPAVAKPLVSYCINEKASPLQATLEPGGSARWLDPYGRLTNEAPTPSTLNTNVDPAGDRFFVYQVGQNGCYSSRSAIRVVVNTTPTLSLAAPVSTVNLGLKVPLKLTFTGSAPYSYTIAGGYSGTSLANDTTITVLPRGNTTYQVTAVTNGCGVGLPGNPATAVVTVRVPTVATGALASSTLCAGTSLSVPFTTTGQFNPGNTFQLELVSAADTSKKYGIPATAGGSPVTATLPLTIPSGSYAVRVRALNPDVGITGTSSPTPLTVRSSPTATLTGMQAIYEGTPASLTITFGGDGPWMLTYADSVRSYSVATAVSPYVAEVRPARTTTYRITTLTNSCGTGPMSGTATVSVLVPLGVDDHSLDPLVAAYPVPTNGELTVELDLPLTRDPAELSLINGQGRSVLQHTTRSRRTNLDLSTQPNGLYILRVQVGDRHTIRKVMKL